MSVAEHGSDVGRDLRAAREGHGWTLDEVAASLRIKATFLRAIEEGDVRNLPGNAYAVGFVRAYALLVRLDPDEVTRRFRTETREVNRKTALRFPAPVPERGVPAGAIVLLGVLLAIGAYIGWYRMSGDRQGTAIVQAVPDRLAPLAESARPLVAGGSAAPTGTSPAVASLASPSLGSQGVAPVSPAYPPTSAAAAMPPLAPPPELGRVALRARSDTWVQVRDAKGQIVLNKVLRPGESWTAPPRQALLLTTGNAGGMDLLVDGVVAPPLNGAIAMRRDIPLDPDAIKGGKLAAQGTTPAAAPAR